MLINNTPISFRRNYQPGKYDAFIFLTGKNNGRRLGFCNVFGSHTAVSFEEKDYPVKRMLQHELSHFFGAEDTGTSDTILSSHPIHFSYQWSKHNGTIIGFVWWRQIADLLGIVEFRDFNVMEGFQRRGIGTKIIKFAIQSVND